MIDDGDIMTTPLWLNWRESRDDVANHDLGRDRVCSHHSRIMSSPLGLRTPPKSIDRHDTTMGVISAPSLMQVPSIQFFLSSSSTTHPSFDDDRSTEWHRP